jgi:hypothetical protein
LVIVTVIAGFAEIVIVIGNRGRAGGLRSSFLHSCERRSRNLDADAQSLRGQNRPPVDHGERGGQGHTMQIDYDKYVGRSPRNGADDEARGTERRRASAARANTRETNCYERCGRSRPESTVRFSFFRVKVRPRERSNPE